MSDLSLVRDLAPEAPLASPAELTAARSRLAEAIVAERAPGAAPEPSSPGLSARGRAAARGRRARRGRHAPAARRIVLIAAVAAAAAGATTLVAGPWRDSVPASRPPAAASRPPTAASEPPAAVKLAAAPFFRQAATVVGRQHVAVPGPDQFVYTETRGADRGPSRQWLSAAGNKAGLVQNAGQRAFRSPPCTVAQAQGASKCDEQAGYLPSMPTDPDKLLAYLVKVGIADPPPGPGASQGPAWEANDLGKALDYLMQTTYLLPAQQAALFELMAKTPGYTVVPGARDAIGRTGVAVRWTYNGAPAEIILNPVSYAYLGDRTWPAPGFHGKDADAYDGGSLIRMAFVDRAGELP
jgi:hypothetical protein